MMSETTTNTAMGASEMPKVLRLPAAVWWFQTPGGFLETKQALSSLVSMVLGPDSKALNRTWWGAT